MYWFFWVYFHCILSVSRWLVLYSVVLPIIECNCECTLVLYWRNVTKSVLKTPLNSNQPTKHWAIDKLPYYEECHSAFSASPQSFFSEVGAYEGWKESGFSYPQFFPVNFPIFLLLSVQHGVCRERHCCCSTCHQDDSFTFVFHLVLPRIVAALINSG